MRYSLYQTKLTIPNTSKRPYNDCWYDIGYGTSYPNCVNNGEASIALKQAAGERMTSLAGFTLNYNTLDNNRNPR